MSFESIGLASKEDDLTDRPDSVVFNVPYGDVDYMVALGFSDLDKTLQNGCDRLLGNKALGSYEFAVDLEIPDLPLLIGAFSLNIQKSTDSDFHEVDMDIGVATWSEIYEHRGILSTSRRGWDGYWEYTNYKNQPKLK